MSRRDPYDLIGVENNIIDEMKALKKVQGRIFRKNVRAQDMGDIIENTDIFGARFIAPAEDSGADPTDSAFSGSFLAGEEQILSDGNFWLAKVVAGLVSMGFGSNGIFSRLFSDVLTQVSDDGTTYRKGRLGMFSPNGLSAPAFGVNFQDNNVSLTELLTNGGFETGDMTGWTTVVDGSGSGRGVITSWKTPMSPAPAGSIYFGCPGGVAGANYEYTQTVNVSASTIYLLSFYGFYNLAAGKITVEFYSGAAATGTLLSSFTKTSGSTGSLWVFNTAYIFSPATAVSAKIRMINDAGGSSFPGFDGVSFKNVAISNYFGFHPSASALISSQLDGGYIMGRVPVNGMHIPRVEEAKDKLTATAGAAGNVNVGTHYLITTFVDAYGETDADLGQASSVVVSASAKTVALTAIPLGRWGTVARKVYATIAGATSTDPTAYYLLTTIADNTTTTATYNVTDASLVAGARLPTVNTTGSRPMFPQVPVIWADELISNATQAITTGVAQPYYYYRGPAAADANDGDTYEGSFWCAAGTYTIHTLGWGFTTSPKVDYYIDNVLVSSGQDWYNTASAEKTISSVVIATSGYHHLLIKVNGKNASSTDYRFMTTKIWFMPSAY